MGSLRIHFSAEDLARTRVASGPDPLWEVVLSAAVLGSRHSRPQYLPWRRETLAGLGDRPELVHVRTVAALVPPASTFPDFLTPHLSSGADDASAAIERVAATPPARIRADMIAVFGHRPPSTWVRELAGGTRSAMRELTKALTCYYQDVLRRCHQRISDSVHADRMIRAGQAINGTEALLQSLPAPISWSGRVLRADYPVDRDIHLGGRGIRLIPSYFCHDRPVTLIDPELPPVLVYPADSAMPDVRGTGSSPQDALIRLLGRTRAHVLAATQVACTTTELAARIDSSISMASRHASVLAGAGLISSRRRGGAVLHVITHCGKGLLEHATDR